ncbi:MAG: dehydrogenase [Verrucomicrobiales bacterium]|nr:dehydrogenase [Verrucomicrobiales bacterium]
MKRLSVLLLCSVAFALHADDWPQWRGPNRDGAWRETGIIEKFPAKQIARKWSVPIGGGYSGPTVANGRVYVTDRIERPEQERIHCVDFKTGKKLWTHEYAVSYRDVNYPAGPRAAVTIDEGRAYALGAKGHFHCLDAKTGKVLWEHDCFSEYRIRLPIWGIAASPVVDGDLVVVMIGGTKACVVAFDKKTGEEKWRALDDRANYATPTMIEQAGKKVLVFWTGEQVAGLAPQSGKVLWAYPFKARKMPLGISTPIQHQDILYFTGFYDGSLMLRPNPKKLEVSKVWRRIGRSERSTDSLHSIISTPVLLGDYIYGVDSYGEFRCLELMTGNRVWEDRTATPQDRWSTIHFVQNGDRTWMFNEAGELIIAELSPGGFNEISRAKLIDPTPKQLRRRLVVWSHPAYAYRHVFARNDRELICASLAAD